MESGPPFADYPDLPIEETANAYALSPSLPTDQCFVTRPGQFPAIPSPIELVNPHEASAQEPWWEPEVSPYTIGYLSNDLQYGNQPFPWNNGLSNLPGPQSPRSSNSSSVPTLYHYSPPIQRDDAIMPTFGMDYNAYAIPDSFIKAEPSPGWPSSHSEPNPSPETWRSSPSHPENTYLAPRPKARASSTSRVRKPTEKSTASAPARHRRHLFSGSANHHTSEARQTFNCSFAPYGCESTFVSKNEWKRHVTSQHLQLGFYRCDVGKCNIHTNISSAKSRSQSPSPGQPNDFNRKDLFTQHHRRMHVPWLQTPRRVPTDTERADFESSLEAIRRRCWHALRDPPAQSHCGFCGETFSGKHSWEMRMEHVGRHFEREDKACLGNEIEDVALREWGLAEGILTLVDGRFHLTSLVSDI
ncbi:hypothetical protein N7475_008756 [Penicillium sp. IBT 31633x]|nr:hypothetical protein N7475_008756 [Penicillium sp. IBT 31633x]